MSDAKRRNARPDELRVRLLIPARFVRKKTGVHYKQAPETEVYKLLSDAFSLNLGRCNWDLPLEIIARPNQFGIFMCLLNERGLSELGEEITYNLFKPGEPAPVFHTFDATEYKGRQIDVLVQHYEVNRTQ